MALHASPQTAAPVMPIAENPNIMGLGEVVADEETPGVEITVGTEEAVQCGFWGSSDGKWGVTTKVWVRPRYRETLQEASKRAARLATQTYRELWGIMESGD